MAEPPKRYDVDDPVDPTRNVLDLVEAESKRQDGLREAAEKFSAAIRAAETKRIDELSAMRLYYEEQLSKQTHVVVGYAVAFLTLIITAMGIALVWIE